MLNKTRNAQMDIIRGIGMTLIVLGHSFFPYTKFLYLFHLAIFFILSGFLFKEDYVKDKESLKKFVINKVKRLYMPYVISHIICILLNNWLIKINFYDTIRYNHFTTREIIINILKAILLRGNVPILGLTWFIPILFIITIGYGIIEYIIKNCSNKNKDLIQLTISIIFFAIGYYLSIKNINLKIMGLQVLTCYILFDLGRKISKYKKETKSITKIFVITLSFILLLILSKLGKIEIAQNEYTNPIYFMFASILGWSFIFELSYFISKIKIISHILQYIGRNTMPIIIGQFIVFEIVKLIVEFRWWPIYVFFGILIPIAFNQIKNTLKIKIMKG